MKGKNKMSKLAIKVEGDSVEELLTELKNVVSRLETVKAVVEKAAPLKTKKADKSEDEEVEEVELDESEEEAEEVVEVEEDEAPSKQDVIKAFKAFINENDNSAAKKVLAKFKVKSVQDLKEKDYAKVISLLS